MFLPHAPGIFALNPAALPPPNELRFIYEQLEKASGPFWGLHKMESRVFTPGTGISTLISADQTSLCPAPPPPVPPPPCCSWAT